MNKQAIYTKANWDMLMYLWPNGSTSANSDYTVWLDCESNEYYSKLDKLRKHSEYLALIVHSYSELGCLCITKGY